MHDDGVAYIIRVLEEQGPLTLEDLKAVPDGRYGFQDWNWYLQKAFDYCVEHKRIVEVSPGIYDVDEFFRSPPKPKLVDPNRQYYCKKCFYVLRKLVFMRTMGDTGLHMCPECKDVEKMEWMEARAYCDNFILHYRKLKEQIDREMELQEDDDE